MTPPMAPSAAPTGASQSGAWGSTTKKKVAAAAAQAKISSAFVLGESEACGLDIAWKRPNETELSYRWRERAWIAIDMFS